MKVLKKICGLSVLLGALLKSTLYASDGNVVSANTDSSITKYVFLGIAGVIIIIILFIGYKVDTKDEGSSKSKIKSKSKSYDNKINYNNSNTDKSSVEIKDNNIPEENIQDFNQDDSLFTMSSEDENNNFELVNDMDDEIEDNIYEETEENVEDDESELQENVNDNYDNNFLTEENDEEFDEEYGSLIDEIDGLDNNSVENNSSDSLNNFSKIEEPVITDLNTLSNANNADDDIVAKPRPKKKFTGKKLNFKESKPLENKNSLIEDENQNLNYEVDFADDSDDFLAQMDATLKENKEERDLKKKKSNK